MNDSATALPVPSIGAQLAWILHRIRYVAIGLVVLFFTVVLLEATRLLQSAAGIHPLLAMVLSLAIAAGVGWTLLPLWRAIRLPRVVCPPKVPAEEAFEVRHLAEQARYLERYVRNCASNPELA